MAHKYLITEISLYN